ncbi:hypothetical protein [Pleomorphomonas carboxyditropha]|uniref:Uncharacterized protein n=1 Tax=Pleomorphomonas carboxyditropha TaxID=2023338 RepID=A0A2G9WPD6_9HYPH|nr:hypothetical protein [Pleomorphomonas carboxyditropha]PIO96579.1 hypothetical protein CJ014_24770 [Pleomorphomonas carboxyditropha]
MNDKVLTFADLKAVLHLALLLKDDASDDEGNAILAADRHGSMADPRDLIEAAELLITLLDGRAAS